VKIATIARAAVDDGPGRCTRWSGRSRGGSSEATEAPC